MDVFFVGENRHDFRSIAHVQSEVAAQAVTGVDFQARQGGLLEIDGAYREGINADRQLRKQVFAHAIGDGGKLLSGGQVLGDDSGAGEHAAGTVLNTAGELAGIHLGERRRGQEEQERAGEPHRRPVYRNCLHRGAVAFVNEIFVAVGCVRAAGGRCAGAVDALSDAGDTARARRESESIGAGAARERQAGPFGIVASGADAIR